MLSPERGVDRMTASSGKYKPGFQESTHSGVRVTIYQHGIDPVVAFPIGGTFPLDGRKRSDDAPSVIGVNTSKDMGSASGSFSIQLKPSAVAESLLDRLEDDDWVDIEFLEHNRPYHVMRGLLDEIRSTKAVGGHGATMESFTLTGRDFGKIWETTPVWFSPLATNDIISQAVAIEVFNGIPGVLGNPAQAVEAYLKSFLEQSSQQAGPNWNPPRGMPGIIKDSFIPSVNFSSGGFRNVPERINFNKNYLQPNGTLWDLAVQHSDPLFCEVYADLQPHGNPYGAEIANRTAMEPKDTKMTVTVRDKPFPISRTTQQMLPDYYEGIVPLIEIKRQDVLTADVGRSGIERFNAFYVASLILQEEMGSEALTLLSPLIDLEDVKLHGLRRMDVQSSCAPSAKNINAGLMAEQQRHLIRDWYCLNPYFLSGTITLGRGHPEIHIGNRVIIPGASISRTEQLKDEIYYVESVSNNWQFGTPTQTVLGVTRGWRGDDDSYRRTLNQMVTKYTIPQVQDEEVPVDPGEA